MTKDTADRILNAAAELFAERGYVGTSTRAIAERAGVNEVTLFRRFENKLGVLKALGARISESFAGEQAMRQTDPTDAVATLSELASLEIEGALRSGGMAMRLAFEAKSVPELSEMLEGSERNRAALAAYIADRQAAGRIRPDLDPGLVADVFFAVTSTLVMSRQLLGGDAAELADEHVKQQVMSMFFRGVLTEKEE